MNFCIYMPKKGVWCILLSVLSCITIYVFLLCSKAVEYTLHKFSNSYSQLIQLVDNPHFLYGKILSVQPVLGVSKSLLCIAQTKVYVLPPLHAHTHTHTCTYTYMNKFAVFDMCPISVGVMCVCVEWILQMELQSKGIFTMQRASSRCW